MRAQLAGAAFVAGSVLALGMLQPATSHAQPADLPIAPADGSALPRGVSVRQVDGGQVYVDGKRRVLYGMDMRTVLRWAPDPAQYCTGACRDDWEPLLAPADAQPNVRFPRDVHRGVKDEAFINPQKAPDWTVIAGPDGPQWVYKGWHMVFTRRGEEGRSAAFDGAGELTWNTLKFVPPPPAVTGPAGIAARFVAGRYVMVDGAGRALFTGTCAQPCAWRPFAAPMAGRGMAAWSVLLTGDRPQWAHKGKPVFVAGQEDATAVPAGAQALLP